MKKTVIFLISAAVLSASALTSCGQAQPAAQTAPTIMSTEPEYRDPQGLGYAVLDDGTLKVTAVKDKQKSVKIKAEYKGKQVSEIGQSAFKRSGVESVTIENGIEEIGDYSFAFCSSLKKIEIPKSVKRIGSNAFAGCTSLRNVKLPKGLEEIGVFAFNGSGLEKIEIPAAVKELSDYSLAYCESLTAVNVKGKKTKPGENFLEGSKNAVLTAPKGSEVSRLAHSKDIEVKES